MRQNFGAFITTCPVNAIWSGDECPIEMSNLCRKYGHSKKNSRAVSYEQRVVKLRYSLLMFVSLNGVEYYELVDTTERAIDSQRLSEFITRCNASRPTHVLFLLDNASVHDSASLPNVIWQSPYSPDLNPIEKVSLLYREGLLARQKWICITSYCCSCC